MWPAQAASSRSSPVTPVFGGDCAAAAAVSTSISDHRGRVELLTGIDGFRRSVARAAGRRRSRAPPHSVIGQPNRVADKRKAEGRAPSACRRPHTGQLEEPARRQIAGKATRVIDLGQE